MVMKIAVSATGPSLDDLVDPRFGRCACFLIIDLDTLDFQVLENPSNSLSVGAGMKAAQALARWPVQHVLTGCCGPHALKMLSAAGVYLLDGFSGTVREAVERFGRLTEGGALQSTAHRQPNADR
jgi:predicted Fe-Mo cluster-binding NifX family protein